MAKKKFSKDEIKNFKEGIETGREDFTWCEGNRKRINECIKTRYGLRDLCKSRNDKNGISFQNGYLTYFFNRLKKKRK